MKDILDANTDAFRQLHKALRFQKPLALVGSGLSRRVGYPTWEGLLSELHNRALETKNRYVRRFGDGLCMIEDLTFRADLYRAALREKPYQQFLADTFSPRRGAKRACKDKTILQF